MKKLSCTRQMWDENDYMSGGQDTTTVLLSRHEARSLKNHDEETEYYLFDIAEIMSVYYGGPGRAFIHPAGYHIEWKKINGYYQPVAIIHQSFGFDI